MSPPAKLTDETITCDWAGVAAVDAASPARPIGPAVGPAVVLAHRVEHVADHARVAHPAAELGLAEDLDVGGSVASRPRTIEPWNGVPSSMLPYQSATTTVATPLLHDHLDRVSRRSASARGASGDRRR